ncbi:hypothetical protein LWI29_019280 [Acer saccharum]|uniref:Uncharacterized protein n=1 Tax=Acer saccharum TaxID=4024 RepID=A0AA39SLE5_ACESA|nr:hypothetical protein LWI29_019280 [Acer saccharum]
MLQLLTGIQQGVTWLSCSSLLHLTTDKHLWNQRHFFFLNPHPTNIFFRANYFILGRFRANKGLYDDMVFIQQVC